LQARRRVGQHPAADVLSVRRVVRVENPKQVRIRLGEALLRERVSAAASATSERSGSPERQEIASARR